LVCRDGRCQSGAGDIDAAAPEGNSPSDGPPEQVDERSDGGGDANAVGPRDLGRADQAPTDAGQETTIDQPPAAPILTFRDPAATPIVGYSGPEATIFQDACPKGTVVIGFNIATDDQSATNVVFQLQTICGEPTVTSDGTTVHLAMSSTLFLRGTMPATLSTRLCPADQIVVGFEGHAFDLLDQLAIRCAGLTVTGMTAVVGPATTLPPAGGPGGTPFPRTDCPAGRIAIGANIGVRNWISAFGLTCATIGVVR
jgi:hypothetical protein